MSSRERSLIVLLVFVVCLLYLTRLDHPGFLTPGEGRYAEAAHAMVRTGDWIVPRVNGQIHLEKPPLLYWLVAGSFSLNGASETSARIVSSLASLVTGFMVFILGRRIYGPIAGWLSVFILLSGGTWSIYGRFVTTDIPTIAFQAIGVWAYWMASKTGKRSYLLSMGIALAACTLIRGFLGVAIPVITIFVFSLTRRKWGPRDPLGWLYAIILILVLVVPWHVMLEMKMPGFLRHYLVENHLYRFAGDYPPRGASYLSLGKFWLASCVGYMPWSLFIPAAILSTWRRIQENGSRHEGEWLGLIWAGSVFLIVSISEARLERYFLPACPGLALWMGGRLSCFTKGKITLRPGWVLYVPVSLIIGIGLILAWIPLFPWAPQLIPRGKGIMFILPWIGSFFALGGVFALWLLVRRGIFSGFLAVACGTFLALAGAQQAVAKLDPYISMRQVTTVLKSRNDIRERLILDGLHEIHEGADSYYGRNLYEGLEFYLGRPATVLRNAMGENEARVRWDAAFQPFIVPKDFEKLWAAGDPTLLITRWGDMARGLLFHYPQRTRVIEIFPSTWVLSNHSGK